MSLEDLSAENVRSLARISLQLHPGQNLVWGANGSGKTSLLEAVFLLGRGRSFRTRNSERLIRYGQDLLWVAGKTAAHVPLQLGVQISRDGTIAKIAGDAVRSLAELAPVFPVQIIDPGVHRLLEEGAAERRRWLDWGVFHVEHHFLDHWTRYNRTLKQRNAALRAHSIDATIWDGELIRAGELVTKARREFIDRLSPYWQRTVATLLGIDIEIAYAPGWPKEHSLAEALVACRARDLARGITHAGPHRADVLLRASGRLARDILSRGQQKLIGIAMILGQLKLLKNVLTSPLTLLVDDPAAELDVEKLACFAAEVEQLECQLIVTALQEKRAPFGRPDRMFHVEQGVIQPV